MIDFKKLVLRHLKMICIVVGLAMPIESVLAVNVSCNANPDNISGIVRYNTTGDNNTYCELCGIGQVHIVVTNPTNKDMADFSVQHIFDSNELEYVPGSTQGGGNPVISNGGRTLTWTAAQFPALAQLDGVGGTNYNTVDIIFQVRSRSGFEENLVNADRDIEAFADFRFCPNTTDKPASVFSGKQPLPLHEPIPSIQKRGRNVDSVQNSWSGTVYGNINDDVIWRIRIQNSGLAALQDLKFNDLMQNGNFIINYACPSFNEANTIANADGAGPVGNCIDSSDPINPISNNITNFKVDDPFGNPSNDEPGAYVDVPANGTTDIYLVGKITSSCVTNKTNTVDNVEWGCEVNPGDGGISQTSTGGSAGTSTTTLSSLVRNNNLVIQRALTGLNTSQPVGSRGLMTITVNNLSGGSIKNIHLKNLLPAEYVVDSTFTPTITVTPRYAGYDGMVDRITWTNPVAGTFPLTSTNPADPLANTAPEFDLWSTTVHPDHADQRNMLRHGDVAVVRFRVIMIKPSHFDLKADMDVSTETTVDSNDPANRHNLGQGNQLTNQLDVTFNNFCNGTLQSLTYNDIFDSFPEDLDISITGGPVFILTNDPTQRLPLQVILRNNGGHYADDFYAYVSFGATMQVVTAPGSCTLLATPPNPAILEVWDTPVDIPATATIYECNHNGLGTIGPNQQRILDFEVIKSTNVAADDLTFRADVVGEIALSNNTLTGSGLPLWFPTPSNTPINNRANNYSLDSVRTKVIGFNLTKNQLGNCSENNVPPLNPDTLVQIGEECTVHIETGGWFGFLTPGFTYIAVQKVQVDDELPNGQGFISTAVPVIPSDVTIKSISLNPPPSPLDEGTFNWKFNQNTATERITIRDQWFRMNATTRILNDPIDTRAAPNVHAAQSSNILNSTFEAVFDNSGSEQVYTLDKNVVGYPAEPLRRVDLTVTEPNILVTKEVCNETLYGVGPACSQFNTSINDGDTQDSYIYRITLTNETTNPVARAPAYNITATDTLDASDLMLVVPFGSDSLDNDGDGLTDEADEGTISENNIYVAPGPPARAPAVLTFSHTHSSALLKIEPGVANSVTLYYRVNPDDAVAPLQTLTNTVSATYDSMENISGNQTVVLGTNSTAGGARVYTSANASATVQMLPLLTVPKEITRLANSTITGTQPQPVAVGEEIEYQLRTFIPVANLTDFYIRDELPAGITCSQAPVVDLKPGGPHDAAGFFPGGDITPTCSGNLVYWYFGNQELTKASSNNLYEFKVKFIARVDNTVGVNDTNVISNGDPSTNTFLSYDNDAGAQVRLNFSKFDIQVHEPKITLTKTYETVNNDAGDVITVTVTATNTDTVATAYNLKVFDDLAAVSNITFLNNVAGTDPPDNVISYGGNVNRPLFSWNTTNPDYAIGPLETKTFTFEISVDIGAQPHEILNNSIQASWQSLPTQGTSLNTTTLIGADGSTTGMRNGAIPNAANAVNDYETTASAISTVPALTMTKSDLDNSQVIEVGLHKNYQIVVTLPEGTTNNLIVNDNLNFSGLSYVLENNATYDITVSFSGIATINSGQVPSEANMIASPADGATGTAVWNFGTVVTTSEDDTTGVPAITPTITINYFARINNDTNTNTGSTLQNQVTTNYTNGETAGTEALIDTTPVVTVTEPVLAVTKVATPITPGPITAGHIIEYVVTITNTGNATAYDLNIVDTLPTYLGLDTTFIPNSTATIGGVAVGTFSPTPANSPNGPLIWGRGNADNSLDLPAVAGNPLVLTYRVVVQAGAQTNTNLINSVQVDWTSLDGASSYERYGDGCPTPIAPNDYCAGPATSTIAITDNTSFTKEFVEDTYSTTTDGVLRNGDLATYKLSLNLQEGTTRSVNVQDVLPAGLSFYDIVSINYDAGAPYIPPGSGAGSNFSYSAVTVPTLADTGTITFDIGDVVNDPTGDATTDTLVIIYRAKVADDNTLAHVPTTTLTNTATLHYTDGGGAAVATAGQTANVTVYQPVMTVPTKIDTTGRTSVANVQVGPTGDTMNFRLESCNTAGLSPAYNIKITDQIPYELDETSLTVPVVTINGVVATAVTNYIYTPPAGRTGFMQFDLIDPVNPGECVRIDYDIGIHNDFGPDVIWYNSVTVDEYWSLPAKAGQQYAALGPTTFGMTNNTPFVPPPEKVMLSPVSDEATIGEEVVYQITIPALNGTRDTVVITDTLDPSLEYVSATLVSVGVTLDDTGSAGNSVQLAVGTIPANISVVLQLRARVANNVNANAGTTFANTTQYSYTNAPDPTVIFGGAITTTDSLKIVEPLLSLGKTVSNVTNPTNPPVAGDVLRYTLTFTASGGVANDNFSNAYNVSVVDTLSSGLAYQTSTSNVTNVSGNTINDPTVDMTGQILSWNLADGTADIDVVEGTDVTVTYDVLVLDTVLANQALTNSAVAQWTSLDIPNTYERTGTASPAVNDYFTVPATTSTTTPDNTVLTKSRLSDTYVTGDANVRIGDIVEYKLSVSLQEGQYNNVVLTDTLPPGLQFEGVVEINGDTSSPYNAASPFLHNDIITPVPGSNPVTFTIGNLTNVADANNTNDNFVIVYKARVLDNIHPQINSIPLSNSATFNYDTASGAASKTSLVGITLLQPTLSVAKTAVAANGVTVTDPTNTILEPNELVRYTVDITNTGLAPAYDLVLDDVIPDGMRNGTATITMVSTTFVVVPTILPDITPVYTATNGLATWNFDSGVAETYKIDPGETLRIVYDVQADAQLGANLTLSNQATARLYYSFDNGNAPTLGGINGVREIYGPSNTATTTLTTTAPAALLKENPINTDVTIGETFTYRITVPEIAVDTWLHDVRIVDNLSTSADLTYVSVTKVNGTQPWTPANTGTATSLVIEDATIGIDIPPNEQAIIDVTVVVNDVAANIKDRTFTNTATYTYNQSPNDITTQQAGTADSTTAMTIIEPDILTLVKTGPATNVKIGTAETFTLKIKNTGNSPAYDVTVVDVLPTFAPAAGGMCDTAPANIVVQMYDSAGTTSIAPALTVNSDYVVNYTGCTLTVTMTNAPVVNDTHLVITYDAELDSDTPHGSTLTNYAWVSQWFSQDTAGAGATGQTRTYTQALSIAPNQGTVGTLDHEDAYIVTTETPTVTVEKAVYNMTTALSGANASPGDLLRYSITITNTSDVELIDFSFTDDLDALNATAWFEAGTLNLTLAPLGADISNTSSTGGTKSTGLIDIRSINLGIAGSANETTLIEFEVVLAASIPDATIVYNQGHMITNGLDFPTVDPAIKTVPDDRTETLITSAPLFEVLKTSDDLTGDPNLLLSGDTLRYTITVKNRGTEDAINTMLRDQLPANTTYIAGSTTLNGIAVNEPTAGVLPLQTGIFVNAPENTTPGEMRADANASTLNVATITFDVTINNNVVNGTIISNQGYVSGSGIASGAMGDTPSDDPGTLTIPNDPTRDVVGNQPLVDAHKTASLYLDNNNNGFLDPDDIIRYTITITNSGATAATLVTFTDAVPLNTTYIANSVTLNTEPVAQPDLGVSPLIAGIPVSSSDLTPPIPVVAGTGILSAGSNAVITFDVKVNTAVPSGTIISNQGYVDSYELPIEPTDADGIDSNGDQPTLMVVGNAELVTIVKSVTVVGGGPALAGGQLEYRVRVSNISSVPATFVKITDDLDADVPAAVLALPAKYLTYVPGSALLDGLANGITYSDPVITADFYAAYGNLQPGQTTELVFRAQINNDVVVVPLGTTITNTAAVYWDSSPQLQQAAASISVAIGGTPGVANVNGRLWHDKNFNNTFDSGDERVLSGWYVDIYRDTTLLGTVISDVDGVYHINGLVPNYLTPDRYNVRFRAPDSNASTAKLGLAYSPPALGFSNGLHLIYDIVLNSGANVQDLNLPIDPNGVVYDSVLRSPIAGASISLLNAASGAAVSSSCFDDENQQGQVTTANGYYKFDLNFIPADCNSGDNFIIQITPPPTGYSTNPSVAIPAQTDATTAAFNVPSCPGSVADALPTITFCEAQSSELAPTLAIAPATAGTNYYLHLTFNNTSIPEDSQIFNNHLPIDPLLNNAVSITKITPMVNVTRSQLIPYTITITNNLLVTLNNSQIIDSFPAGFKYVKGSARLNGVARDPTQTGLQLIWDNIDLVPDVKQTIQLLLIVGGAVNEGKYINKAQVHDTLTNGAASGIASATVRVIPDPAFDCSDIIGKVFDDENLNGYQDENEKGLAGARVVTVKGLEVTSDKYGRFHLTCAVVPDETRGSNFIIKLDDRSLPSGYRVTTENPRVQRATRGKMLKFNFGAAIHRVVSMDMADGVFEKNSDEMHSQWKSRLDLLINQLKDKPSILRLSYLADTEEAGLVDDRIERVRDEIIQKWQEINKYKLTIETEIFWRRGGPPDFGGID